MPKSSYEKPKARLNVAEAYAHDEPQTDKSVPKVVRRGVYISVAVDRNVRKALAKLDLDDRPSSYSEFTEIALARLLELGPDGLEALVGERHAQLDVQKRMKT